MYRHLTRSWVYKAIPSSKYSLRRSLLTSLLLSSDASPTLDDYHLDNEVHTTVYLHYNFLQVVRFFCWKYRIHKLFLREAPILSEEAVDQDNQVLCSSDRLLAVLQNKHGTSANSEGTSNRYPKRTSSALLYGTLLYAILLKELANFSRM